MKVGYELEFCSNSRLTHSIASPLYDWFDIGTDSSLAPKNDLAHMYEIRSRKPMNVVSVDIIQLMLEQLDLAYCEEQGSQQGINRQEQGSQQGINRHSRIQPRTASSSSQWVYASSSTVYASSSTDTNTSSYHVSTAWESLAAWRQEEEGRIAARRASGQPRRSTTNTSVRALPTRKNVFTTRNCGMHVHISWENKRMAHVFYGHLARVLTERFKPFDERKGYCCPDFNSGRGARYNALRWVRPEDGHFEARIFNGTMKLRGIVNNLKTIRNEALLVAGASQAAVKTQSANFRGDLVYPAIG